MPGDPTSLTSGSGAGPGGGHGGGRDQRADLTLSAAPPAVPAPVVISPDAPHDATLLLLPGFTCSAESMAESWMPAISETLGDRGGRLKLVFLNAPEREVSCYGAERPRLQAWHDYFTDPGGDEGRPELEEEIDEAHVAWSRARIHAAIDAEVALLGATAAWRWAARRRAAWRSTRRSPTGVLAASSPASGRCARAPRRVACTPSPEPEP